MATQVQFLLALLLAAFLPASEARPNWVEISGVRILRCPFDVSAEASLETVTVTYDTSNPTFGAEDDEHACTVQVGIQYDGQDTTYYTDIDYTGDAEAEIGTLVAWSGQTGPVTYNTITLNGADTPVQTATNATVARASYCSDYGRTQAVAFNVKTTVSGSLGSVIKQSFNVRFYGHCVPFGCEHLIDIEGNISPSCLTAEGA